MSPNIACDICHIHRIRYMSYTAKPTWDVNFRKLKAQSSNISFATFQSKETFELGTLSFETAFENITPRGIGCTCHLRVCIHVHHTCITVHTALPYLHRATHIACDVSDICVTYVSNVYHTSDANICHIHRVSNLTHVCHIRVKHHQTSPNISNISHIHHMYIT